MTMTREQKEAVVIGFYLDGKKVQIRSNNSLGDIQGWIDADRPGWIFAGYDYRLKPEPVAGWFVRTSNGSFMPVRIVSDQPNKAIYMRECDPPEGE